MGDTSGLWMSSVLGVGGRSGRWGGAGRGRGGDGGAVAVALASLGGGAHVWEGREILLGVVARDHSRTLHFQDLIDRPKRHQTRSLEQFCSLRPYSSRRRPRHLQTPEKNWS